MEHAKSSGPATLAPRAPSVGLLVVVLIAASELGLLLLGFRLGAPFRAAAISLAAVYFLIAFRSPDLAWAVAFLSIPFSFGLASPVGEISVPTEPMIGLALLAWLLRALLDGSFRLPASRVHLPLLVLALVSLASIVLGDFRGEGLKAWVVTAAYVAFGYLYFVCADCDPVRRARWVRMAALSAALLGLYGMARVLALGMDARVAYGAGRPFFSEHGTYAAYLAMILPVTLFEALERRGRWRIYLGAASFLILLGILFSFTRAAWISLVVVLPPALVLWARRRGAWKRLAAATLAAGVGLALLASINEGARLARHAESVVETRNVSNLERINRWIAAWEMTKAHPWIGVGYGAYADAYPSYRRKAVVTEHTLVRMGVHSEPLRLLSETGVAGFLAAIWFLATLGWVGLRRYLSGAGTAAGLTLGLVAGIATYAVHGIFNSYLGIDKITMPFWIEVGALTALAAPRRREP